MRRSLHYAPDGAAAAAAALLGTEFTATPMGEDGLRDVRGVVLIDGDRMPEAHGDTVRIVALVDPAASGPWPHDWYAVLPRTVASPLLARTIRRAFADLERAEDLARLHRELADLNAIGIQLSAERDPRTLLETILTKAREITQADAGSLYLVEEAPAQGHRLRFVLVQNDSVPAPFREGTLPLSDGSVAGHVALTGEIVNLEDAYAPPPGSPYTINDSFDVQLGYRTKSMLVVPMRTPDGETIGALQLINCKREVARPLRDRGDIERDVVPFGPRHVSLAASLASQAAVAVENSRLYHSIRELFEAFVAASVAAIESRDPATSGHSFRVADLTLALAEAVSRATEGAYAGVRFTAEEMTEIRYAALLHDFGKVGVREQVLVKAKKLYPGELALIRERAEGIRRDIDLRATRLKLDWLLTRGRDGFAARAANVDAEAAADIAALEAGLECVIAANEPSATPRSGGADIPAIAERLFEDDRGRRRPLLTMKEARALTIARGSLTEDEVREIQSHVTHTFHFLSEIAWANEFRRVPDIARAHHEKLDGSGYPYRMTGGDIALQAKMMAVADVYDALTASDRPYKKAMPCESALAILRAEAEAGKLDAELVRLFIDTRVFERSRPR